MNACGIKLIYKKPNFNTKQISKQVNLIMTPVIDAYIAAPKLSKILSSITKSKVK